MRSLNRNKRTIYYALRTGDEVNLDEYGNETGETTPQYGDVVMLQCNISAASGQEAVEAFGSFTGYARTMCVADNTCPILFQNSFTFSVTRFSNGSAKVRLIFKYANFF